MGHESAHNEESSFPGNVLVAGSGFIVTGAGWGLFGYLEGDLAATSNASIFFAMALLHILTGVLVFSRQGIAVWAGIALAAVGLVIAAIQPQFVLVFTNAVIVLLLILARGNVAAGRRTA